MNKKISISALSLLGVAVIGAGTFAFFNATAKKEFTGENAAKIGAVAIDANSKLEHEGNLNNINPGDNDASVPKENRNGTDHELSVTVKNTGSKSIMTRNIITIEAKDKDGKAVNLKKDGKTIVLLTEKTDSSKLGDSSKKDKENRGLSSATPIKLNVLADGTKAQAVVDGVALNGSEEKEEGVTKTENVFVYDLGLAKEVENELANGKIEITIETQALQYRNTGSEDDWKTFKETKIINEQGVEE